MTPRPTLLLVLATALCGTARAQPAPGRRPAPASQPARGAQPASQPAPAADEPLSEDAAMQTTVRRQRPLHDRRGRAATRVDRRDLEERLPRSAPDALRYEPGVYVQQSAHGQGSAYIRGRTGQQTVLLFDGIRLNNSTFRQGPNQYFFTIDTRTIRRVDVVRGGASTLYGTDAIAGALDAQPVEPTRLPGVPGVHLHPGAMLRYASADAEVGGRAQLDGQLHRRLSLLGGVGYRHAGLLQAGGPIVSPQTGRPPQVPRFADDGFTQLGTGYAELASDLRLALELRPQLRLVAALYDYRLLDAPRTDQCPPAHAPRDACLTYEEQFRTLSYLALEGRLGRWARRLRVALSYQNQHERRANRRPSSFTVNGGRDDVHTMGLLLRARSAALPLARWLAAAVDYGGDFYFDWLRSRGWTEFTDVEQVLPLSRGQYLDGSTYGWGGAFALLEATLRERLILRGGGRVSGMGARAPADSESSSRAVDRRWFNAAGQLGLEWRALSWLALLGNFDRSFRAPNLDDLTSRQQAGPGFQFENAALRPESALTLELGLRLDAEYLQGDLWGYWTSLRDAIERAPRSIAECPAGALQCASSWSRFQLVNLAEPATIWGAEAILRAFLPRRITLRATIAYAIGDGPSPASELGAQRVPLSRIPPLNGTFEARWRHRLGVYAGVGLRWALAQDRLSLGDRSDERIPVGGTPGFATVDLLAGYRLRRNLLVSAMLQNLGDAAYRYHGSSVNGPGRGVVLSLEGRY